MPLAVARAERATPIVSSNRFKARVDTTTLAPIGALRRAGSQRVERRRHSPVWQHSATTGEAILPYLTEPEPERGRATDVAPGIRRILAPNAGLMTYHGTNTYLIEAGEGVVVLDPGPDDAGHVQAILEATEGCVAAILLSHSHSDHLGALAALKAGTGPGPSPSTAVPIRPSSRTCRLRTAAWLPA